MFEMPKKLAEALKKGFRTRHHNYWEDDFDIWNEEPRQVICLMSYDSGMMICGDKDKELEIGKTYTVESVDREDYYTLLYIKELHKEFNSVFFREMPGYESPKD